MAPPLSIEGVIKLIHTREDKSLFSNWRRITCLTSTYKILSKSLALRITTYMDQWIRKEQKGFIKGRFILDAFISLWEGIEFAKSSN